jgi:hypothetical protein
MVAYGDRTALEHSVQKRSNGAAFTISIDIRLETEQFAITFTQNTDGAYWEWFGTGWTQFPINQISSVHGYIGVSSV